MFGTEEGKSHYDGFTWHVAGVLPKAIGSAVIDLAKGERKIPSLNPTGGKYQFPADFLVNKEGKILDVNYGKDIADQWSVEGFFVLAKTVSSEDETK